MNGRTGRGALRSLFEKALEGADPGLAVSLALGDSSIVRTLSRARRIGVFACGKAAAAMVRALPEGFQRGALVVLPRGYPAAGLLRAEVLFASHPEPDSSSVSAARRALAYFSGFGAGDAILCLVSGGTSSLLAKPRRGVTLEAKRRAVRRLMRAGASILEINRLRASLSAVKGGRLGRATRARLVTLVLSDVPGDDPALVGSGPTVRGRSGDVVRVVGSNRSGLEAAAREARRRGLIPRIERRRFSGEAFSEGMCFGRAASRLGSGRVLLAGGETAVTIRAASGRGGRNLEFALGAASELAGSYGLVLLAAGSDGVDGSSKSAGAFADTTTLDRARRLGLDPARALSGHDTEPFFRRLGDLFLTGPTGTNVCDWAFAVRW